MKRTTLLARLIVGFVLLTPTVFAQNQYLNFYPWVNAATSGTMTSDANPDQFGAKTGCITGDVSVALSGGAWTATYPKWTNTTPATWSSSFGFEMNVDWSNTSQTATMTVDFKKSASLIELPIEFFIADLNAAACASTAANRFIDVVTIVGYKSNLSTVVYPSLVTATCGSNSVGGANNNVIYGNPNCGSNNQGARIQFYPTDKIARLVITYSSGTGTPVNLAPCAPYPLNAGENPKSQYIRISSIKLNYDCTNNIILPVELKDFDVQCVNSEAVINWSTETERDNAFFTVQRSANGVDFESIGQVDGAGTTTVEQQYRFIDPNPHSDISYYRLLQTDFNGFQSVHELRSFDGSSCMNTGGIVTCSPQPVSEELEVKFNVQRSEDVTLVITNSLGESVLQLAQTISPSDKIVNIPMGQFSSGTYFLQGFVGNVAVRQKLVKL